MKAPDCFVEMPSDSIVIFRMDGRQHYSREVETADGRLVFLQERQNKKSPRPPTTHLGTLTPGQSESFSQLVQLPSDAELRPSTVDGSRTPIRISHELQINVVYSEGKGKVRQLQASKRVQLASVSTPLS